MTRKRIWKRWRRWGLVLGIFALAIPASAGALVRSGASRQRLHSLATTAIREELGLRATIGRVQIQLVPFSLVARDITLDDPVYGRFATAEELRIQPSFRALLRGALDLDVITIRRADLRLVVRNGQVRNLPRADAPAGEGGPTLPFDELHVLESTLTVDAQPHASGQIRDVDLHVSGTDGGIAFEADTRSGWVEHAGGREELELFDGRVELTEDALHLPRLDLRTADVDLSVRGGRVPIALGEHGYSGQVELAYELSHLARLPLPEDVTLPPFEGRVTVDLGLDTDGETQHADGTIDLEGVSIEQWGLGERVHLIVRATPGGVEVVEGSVGTLAEGGGEVGIAGTVSLDPETGFETDVVASLNEVSFARLMKEFSVTDDGIVECFFNGTMALSGTIVPLRLEGPVRSATHDFRVSHEPWHHRRPRRVIGVSRADVTARWSIREDAVRFNDIVAELPNSRFTGDVHLGYDNRLGVQAVSEHIDLSDAAPLDRWDVQGVGTASLAIDRTFQDPRVQGHVRFEDFVFDSFELGTIESDALLDPDGMGVHFAMVTAEKNESRYRAEQLYLDFHDNRFAMDGTLHLDGMRLADFYEVFGFEEDERFAPYQGLTRGMASLRYTNGFPNDSESGTLDVDMNLTFDHATLDDYRFDGGSLVGHWRWLDWDRGAAGAELTIAHLALRKGRGTIALDGRMDLGGQLSMNAVADRIALSDLEGIGDRLEGLEGVATAVGRIGGTFDVMRADFDVGVTNVTYEGRALGDGRFFVRLTDETDPYVAAAAAWDASDPPDEPCARARLGLANANWPADPPVRTRDGPQPRLSQPMAYLVCGSALDERLQVDLAVGRTGDLPLRGRLALGDLALQTFFPSLREAGFGGAVTGELVLEHGSVREPETLRGSVTLGNVHVAQGELEIRNRRPVSLSFADGVMVVNKARFIGPDSRLRVRGRASIEDGYALTVDGDLDLALLAQLSAPVERASGNLSARLNVSGPLDDPELYGQAELEGGNFNFAAFDAPLENLGGRIRFSERSVIFEGFEGEIAGGRVEASGSAELQGTGLERYRLDIDVDDIEYEVADGVDTRFAARTHLTWDEGERVPTLRGELRLARLEYSRPIALRSLGDITARVVRGIFTSERTEVRRYDPERDSVEFDVRVTQGNQPLRIANNLIQADVRIDGDRPFQIVGTDQRYGVIGAMSITRGQIYFQNNEFDVRRGAIRFDDATRIDPQLDIEAVTEIRRTSDLASINWRVMLHLVGSSDNLQLVTDSDPDLPQPDILMLLAFGMTRSELQQLQAGDVGGVAALEALTSVTGVDREIRRAVPLIDDVRLTSGYSTRTGRSEPRLSIGKRIAERVRLSATTGLGEGREFRGALEWQLDDNMRLGVSYDNYNIDGSSSFGNLGVDWGYRLEFE